MGFHGQDYSYTDWINTNQSNNGLMDFNGLSLPNIPNPNLSFSMGTPGNSNDYSSFMNNDFMSNANNNSGTGNAFLDALNASKVTAGGIMNPDKGVLGNVFSSLSKDGKTSYTGYGSGLFDVGKATMNFMNAFSKNKLAQDTLNWQKDIVGQQIANNKKMTNMQISDRANSRNKAFGTNDQSYKQWML